MEYVIHDTTAYGIYNGIDVRNIEKICRAIAAEHDFEIWMEEINSIAKSLRDDEELQSIAQQAYIPYPISATATEETKILYQNAVSNRTAPGVADIPDDIITAKIAVYMQPMIDEDCKKKKAIQDAEKAKDVEYNQLMESIKDVQTVKENIKDEGGDTFLYIHHFTFKSGRKLSFQDRNLFDFGRTINPCYPIAEGKSEGVITHKENGVMMWMSYQDGKGFVSVRPLDDEELIALALMDNHIGFANSRVRM